MDWNSEKILETVDNLRKDYLYLNENDIMTKYEEFKTLFPKLFYTCLEPSFNHQELKNMLEFRDQAKNSHTPDLVRDTKVGEYMAKKYVYPVTGEPSLEEKKEAAKKVAKKDAEQKEKLKNSKVPQDNESTLCTG